MVTETQISNYLASIYETQSIYTDKLALEERLGHIDVTDKRILMTLLGMYVDVMTKYFEQATYDDNGYFITEYNFFIVRDAKDIMLKINLIADTNYSLNLE